MTEGASNSKGWWRLRSLRARLLAGVLVLSAISLVVVSGLLYAQQRRFVYDRVDNQARSAVMAVSRDLDRLGVPGGGGLPGRGPGKRDDDNDSDDRYAQPYGAGVMPRDNEGLLPPNVYGERRDSSGRTLGHVLNGYDSENAPSPPRLPAVINPGRLFTVPAENGDTDYRVYSMRSPGGFLTISAVPMSDADSQLDRLLATQAMLFGGALVMIGLFGWWVLGYGLRPLDRMGDTAEQIAEGDLDRRVEPAEPDTEVGRLGLRLNSMLQRIESSFSAQRASEQQLRQFLADASHELRTPLSAIRGYAELHRLGVSTDPDKVEHAMTRIEAESERMGKLVEDLLTLARLDEQREPVREPVVMADLARDAVSDAEAADGSGRTISLETSGGDLVVTGDADQLHQVLGNLLRNALVHTPPGTPIDVRLAPLGDAHVELSVRDHGPGLPVEDTGELFERFWRAAPGRERGPAGAGLGLSIVSAIVDAHGGSVRAESPPDGGARFVIELPLAKLAGDDS